MDRLLEEKKLLEELLKEENKNKNMREPDNLDPQRKFIYNNSSKILTEDQEKLVDLGLNFSVTPHKFP